MEKIVEIIVNKLSIRKEKNSIFSIIKQAFLSLIPIFMIGACSLVLQYFPITVIRKFIQTALNGKIFDFLNVIYSVTFGFSAVYLVISLSYFISLTKNKHNEIRIFSTISTTICFFSSLGIDVLTGKTDILKYTKMDNIFSSLLIAFIFTNLFYLFYKIFINKKLEDNVAIFTRVLYTIFPTLCCLLISTIISFLIGLIPDINNFSDLTILLLRKPFESIGATYFGGLLIMLLESIFWIFGIHGGNVFDNILTSPDSVFAFKNGQIMTKAFVDTFVLMGGCGTIISLFLALIIFSKDRKKKKLCSLASVPLLFNINELLVFGIPIVLNPIYVIPFILTPLVTYSLAYFMTYIGVVPQIVNDSIQWTTPIIINGYQATGSILGSIMQIILIIIGTLIYAPFVKLEERINKENERRYINKLTNICKECEKQNIDYKVTSSNLLLHSFEEDVISKLNDDIINGNIHLHYQPQVYNNQITAAEALLRFKYNDCNYLYPPLVVGMALNQNLFEDLTKEIIKQALNDLKIIQKENKNFKIAVNLRLDLLMNSSFLDWLVEIVNKANVTQNSFGIEITEDANLSDSNDYLEVFNKIKNANIDIIMDDFSMGHTSISFLQRNYFNYIKIDGNLIRNIDNERCKSIVESIVQLGKQLNFQVIAEYVETEKQKNILYDMGCHIYQGYLYYKDIEIEELLNLLKKQ